MAIDSSTRSFSLARRNALQGFSLQKFYPWLLVFLVAYLTADLLIVKYRYLMLPTEAPPAKPARPQVVAGVDRAGLNQITSKNIFAEDGVIPPPLVADGQGKAEEEAAPVPSSLPLNLIGTLVHSDPEKSIATIEVKSKNATIALRVGRDIPGIATLTKVERNKAFIRNLNNNRIEYIEIKQANKLSFNSSRPAAPAGGGEVKVVGQNRFEVNRSDVLKYTSDMASILQQAAMQPRRNASGEIECFKFLAIQPGSIYTQLGFQVGDCLKAVNGDKITSPAQAMEMYNALKSSNNIKLTVERDGRDQENDYTVR